jgi:DNA-binding IscR family transcriptional regulator
MTRCFTQGIAPPTTAELVERFGLPEEVVMRVLERLREQRLVLEAGGEGPDGAAPGWVPGRPPSTILLGDVLGLFRPADPEGSPDALGRLLRELAAHETHETEMSLAELLEMSTGEPRTEEARDHHKNREMRSRG